MSDRQVLRRVAGALCLLLALYCLVAAAAALSARPVSASPEVSKQPERPTQRLPLLIPVVFLVFLVVVTAVVHRGRRRPPQPTQGSREARLR
jgi:peptidoglycan biosynthesis protein MviN/MurJ (putative lipid II flippase)